AGDPVPAKVVCIDAPPPGATVPGAAGARVCVSGFVAGAFEQNVVIEVRDDAGRRLALAPATAFGADLGLFATRWEIEIRLADDAAHATGRVVAYTTSPRDGSIETRAEVPVRFAR
ncbi:MAG: hypothetical protein FJZ92_08870, partial [Chloroflexi bacterium]|nr:hypothetical protein [Chloroflexota bacterium]